MIAASYSCRHLIQYIPRSLSYHSHYSHHHHFNFGLSLVNTNGAKVVKIVELGLYQNLSIHETWELRASKWATTSNPSSSTAQPCPVACDMSCYFCSSPSLEICQCQRHIHRLAVGLMEFLDIDGHRWPKWDALGPLESCPFLPIYTHSMQREETYRKVRM